jgi:hypothetical protein
MSFLLGLVAAGAFALGAVVGVAASFAMARRKFTALHEAAVAAGSLISQRSEHALSDLSDAHARAEAMIDAIENAKISTGRAKLSVTSLMTDIHKSREKFEHAASEDWFEGPLLNRLNRRAEPAE